MSLDLSGEITAIATAVLAAFAIVTAFYARRAFLKQSQEVSAIERQVKDQEELTQQQAELLRVQSGQLELQRQQFEEQRTAIEDQIRANARQAEVLELQTEELRESLAERNRVLEEQRRSQAGKVAAWFGGNPYPRIAVIGDVPIGEDYGAVIRNASDLPVLDIRAFFHYVDEVQPGAQWQPVMRGGPVQRIRVLPPGSEGFIPMPDNVRSTFGGININTMTCVVSIEFTDTVGNCWERDPRGALVART